MMAVQIVTPEIREILKDALYQHMSDISEDHYCAGWMSGNEYRLWNAMTDPDDDRAYGMGKISDWEVTRLRELHNAAGGWWYWHDDCLEPELHHDHWGPRFLTTEEWKQFMLTKGKSVLPSQPHAARGSEVKP